jgi:predicted transcriptional regulator
MTQNLLTIKPVNQWLAEASEHPDPGSLFGDFWLEGELAVLFSDAGRGKSLLGVQIADSIARGKPIGPVPMTAKPRKVLYFDFEFSAKQFEMRYSSDDVSSKDSYRFPKNFHRAQPAELAEPAELASIEDVIRASRAKVVVIDSIAWLQGPNITARHTVPLMRELKRLQSTLGLSILILAHNPRRDTSRPLTISGLHGAGVMCNFADSVFAIGQSRIDSSFRYIKHIKSRSAELTCDESNVLVGEVRKWEKNFLSFRFHRYSPESDHLVKELNPLLEERANMIKEMSEERGMTQREIAAKLGISLGSVNRYLQMTREDQDYFDLDDGFDLDDDEPDPETDKQVHVHVNARIKNLQNLAEERPRASSPPAGVEEIAVSADARVVGVSELAEPAELAQLGKPDRVSSPRVAKRQSKCAKLNKLDQHAKPAKPGQLAYKTLDDQINVGDIVRDRNGLLMKKTHWGWDRCAESIK